MTLQRRDIEEALPANLRSAATQQLTDLVNSISSDPFAAETIRDNFLSYAHVLKEGKFKTEDYLNAVAYVTYKSMNCSNQEAYARTFPQRMAILKAKNTSPKDISSYVAAYHKGVLVNKVMERAVIPIWLVNQDNYQRAINIQMDLAINAQSEMVRTTAANSVLTHLSKPKDTAPLINIDIKESTGMKEMREMMEQLAQQQLDSMKGGVSAKEIAGQRMFINGED